MTKRKKMQRDGNACHPIMRKGGAHTESKSGQRQKNRQQTRELSRAWRDHADLSPLPMAA